MEKKTVLDVGNCGPDHNSIKNTLTKHFAVEVLQADGASDALQVLKSKHIDLVLINRKLDQDYSDGTEVLKQLKADSKVSHVPVMIVTNFEEHQQAAIQLGAVEGFGKLSLDKPQTVKRLGEYLATV